jgi:hypothetical protein
LIKDEIPQLYKDFQQNYEVNIIRVAKGAINGLASTLDTLDYWQNRTHVGELFKTGLNSEFAKLHAICTGVQVLNIALDKTKEAGLIETQISKQVMIKNQFNGTMTKILEQIKVDSSTA